MAKLTDYITDVGRPVAFYPKLKTITGSTTATILLSQFLYWTDKTADGWISKDSFEIEEETGLTVNEQRTARKNLVDAGLLAEQQDKLNHCIKFMVLQDNLNDAWALHGGKKAKLIAKTTPANKVDEDIEELTPYHVSPEVKTTTDSIVSVVKPTPERRSAVEKKGDLVDGLMAFAVSPGQKKANELMEIKKQIEKKLHVNATNKKWENFITYAWQQGKKGESLDKFIEYALEQGFNPVYWPPEKMITLWPQAFIVDTAHQYREDFVKPLPPVVEEEYAPMPDTLFKKKNLY